MMIQSRQKVIKIGSSGGVTIPAKEMKRQNIQFGDTVEITIRDVQQVTKDDQKIIDTAKKILHDYKQDFKNLAQR